MRAMKNSGLEWIGVMPSNWALTPLKSMLLEIKEQNNPIQTTQVLSLTNQAKVFPYEERGNQGNKSKEKYEDYKIAYPNTIVLNSMNVLIGSVGICNYFGCVSPVYYVFKNSNSAILRYVNYIFQNVGFQKELRKFANGIMEIRMRVSAYDILHRLVPMPSIQEQRLIADYLDRKCADIDNILEKTKASIEEYKKLKQSVITEAVTKGISGEREMKDSGIPWIGQIPKTWQCYRITNLYEERAENGNTSLPILTVSINTGVSDHEIADEDCDRVFVRSEDKTKYKRVYPSDLAYNMMRAWQGAFGAVRVDGMVSPAYVVAKPKYDGMVDSRYIEALLRTPSAVEEMHRYSHGIADFRLRLYWPEFKNIRICVPPIEEQKEIADYIDEKASSIDSLISSKELFMMGLESYKKSLIYEYVTGKKEVTA